jgi:LPS export ABC transporter protein LptC
MRRRADLLAVGLAALAWLTAACSSGDQPPTTVTAADSADQIGYGMTVYLTVDGIRRMRLEADSTYAYFNAQRYRLFGLRVTFFSPDGTETSTLTGREGTYDWRTGDMEARGDVVAVSPDNRKLTTSVLRYLRRTDQISGPEPFVWTTPQQRVEGEAFTSDPDLRNVQTTRARGAVGRVQIER